MAFASRRGLLGRGQWEHDDTVYSEQLCRWVGWSQQMASLIAVWDALLAEDLDLARGLVTWNAAGDAVRVNGLHQLGFNGTVASLTDREGRAGIGPRTVQTLQEHVGADMAARRQAGHLMEGRAEWYQTASDVNRRAFTAVKLAEARAAAPRDAEIRVSRGTAHLVQRWREGDEKTRLLEPLRVVLANQVNTHLLGRVTYHFDPYSPARFSLEPDSLLSALWLLFASEMGGRDAAERTCARTHPAPGCPNVFTPAKPWQQFCTERCRQIQHYHDGKRRARKERAHAQQAPR
ncbi:MAG TPA: hypothetical protein PKL08_00895 [Thermoanaerobaculaceae bacterium]|nr:hypothetical protein [Thermoanaerobaculaceae bacterium]